MHGLLLKFPGIFSLLLASVSRERASSSPIRVGVSVVGNFAARFLLVARFIQLIAPASRASFCPGGFLVGPNFRLPLRPTGSGSAVLALAGGSNLEQRAGQYGALCCSFMGLLGIEPAGFTDFFAAAAFRYKFIQVWNNEIGTAHVII